MGISGGPDLIQDGLVLCLDASDKNSYPGSGTTWYDVSGNGNNGTLNNGPTFDSGNGGAIVFDGTNDYISLNSNPSVLSQITFEAWVNLDVSNITGTFVVGHIAGIESRYRFIYDTNNFYWVCSTVNNGWYTTGTSIGFDTGASLSNITYHVVGTYNGSFNSLYVNGNLKTTGSAISGNIQSGGTFYIGNSLVSNIAYPKGKGYTCRIYNRALSSSEIKQNYNSQKSRFGL